MSWQSEVFSRLRDREWHSVGVLFDAVEQDIPLHTAMRRYFGTGRDPNIIPPNTEARWLYFKSMLGLLGVEVKDAERLRGLRWNNQIRLSYIKDCRCEVCGGPVIKQSWTSYKHVCLACEQKDQEVEVLIFIDPEICGFPVRLWPHEWWHVKYYFLEDRFYDNIKVVEDKPYLEITPHRITVKPAKLSLIMPLAATATIPEVGDWKPVNFQMPPWPKRRRRRRRAKSPIQRVSTPRLVAPPVIVEPPSLVKMPKPPPGRPVPVKREVLKLKPKTEATPKFNVVKEIWETFVRLTNIPQLDRDPKLRRYLRRALEAGVMEEYKHMHDSITKEMQVLLWPNEILATKMVGMRAVRWLEINITQQQRRRWANNLIQAYTAGAMAIIAITVNGNLHKACADLEDFIAKKQPKIPQQPQPNKPPKPVRQRWTAPFRQARNVLNRYFNR